MSLYEKAQLANQIFARLDGMYDKPEDYNSAETVVAIKLDIVKQLDEGWRPDEIVALHRNREEFNPDLDEDTALRRMRDVQVRVKARLEAV